MEEVEAAGRCGAAGGVELEYRCLLHAGYLEVMALPGDSPLYKKKNINKLSRYTRIIWFLRAEGPEREGTEKAGEEGGGGGGCEDRMRRNTGGVRGEGGGRFMWSILIQADF